MKLSNHDKRELARLFADEREETKNNGSCAT
jgi:hypothetical protein